MKFTTNFKIRCLKNQIAACRREIKRGIKSYALRVTDLYDELESLESLETIQSQPVAQSTTAPTQNILASLTQVESLRLVYHIKIRANITDKIRLVSVVRKESGHCTPAYKDILIVWYMIGEQAYQVHIENGETVLGLAKMYDKFNNADKSIIELLEIKLQEHGFTKAKIIEHPMFTKDLVINLTPANYYKGVLCTYVGINNESYWFTVGKEAQDMGKRQYFNKLSELLNALTVF